MSGQSFPVSTILARLRWKAILLGFAVDYGGSVAFGFAAGLVMTFLHVNRGGAPGEAHEAVFLSTPYLTLALIVGSLFVVVGGFIIGYLAPRARLLNGAVLGVIDILLGLTYRSEVPDWYHYSCLAVTLPCALLGAALAGVFFPYREPAPPPLPPSA